MRKRAFQDQIPNNFCFGCGPGNPQGLQLKSYWDGDESTAEFRPQLFHAAGSEQILNGGIIATLIDCHCICTAIAHAYYLEGRVIGSTPLIWYATASLHVGYLRPTPINQPVTLRAQIIAEETKKTTLHCTLSAAGEPCARGEVLAIRVSEGWRRGNSACADEGGRRV